MAVDPNLKPHDQVFAQAVEDWCDAELLSDDGWQRGTIVGEWHLIVTRQGFNDQGSPISQTFTTNSISAPSRILGILSEAKMKVKRDMAEQYGWTGSD